MRSIEIFTGAGGLALGAAFARFNHAAVMEQDADSCETLRTNKRREVNHVCDWEIKEGDICGVDYSTIGGRIDFLGGGVPCQPFSAGGKRRGHEDERNMFPEFARAVASLRPKAFLIENVGGLLRHSFADYFDYLILQLSHPLVAKRNQSWQRHRAELEKTHTSGRDTGLDYHVVFKLLNAADHGVPQRRERVFIVGFRSDLSVGWSFPEPTHSLAALLRDKWVSRDYWDRHELPRRHRPKADSRLMKMIERLDELEIGTLPWKTVRDAIGDLPELWIGQTDPDDDCHFLNPGARAYTGHSGSPMDDPAKTLKAGSHGVPGGENTLALGDGRVRYFSVRECARLQTFPDAYNFVGSWTSRMRQIGNAVPVELARIVSANIMAKLRACAKEKAWGPGSPPTPGLLLRTNASATPAA